MKTPIAIPPIKDLSVEEINRLIDAINRHLADITKPVNVQQKPVGWGNK